MEQQTKTLSYTLDEFMKFRDKNNEIPQELIPYFYNNRDFMSPSVLQYGEYMRMIISTINNGMNTNDVIFKNNVKYIINIINKKNFNDAVNKLKELDFSTRENLSFLINELIICSMRCPISIKGIHREKNGFKSISEIIMEVIKIFCNFIKKDENNTLSFHEELLKTCRKFFMDFVNVTKSMDINNENTSDNYKGFMTFLGLLYENNLLPNKIILECTDSIQRTIFCFVVEDNNIKDHSEQLATKHEKMFGYNKNFDSELYNNLVYFDTENIEDSAKYICYRNSTECSNFYKGYENLANHIINNIDSKLKNCEKNTEFINKQILFLEQFIDLHNKFMEYNQLFKITSKDQMIQPLKQHLVIVHNEIGTKLNDGLKKFKNL